MSIFNISKRLLILMGLCWLCAMPLMAQEVNLNYQEALRRIEEARVSGRKWLDLKKMNLESLPPEIGLLTEVEVLLLNENQFTVLPPEIGQLSHLRSLNLQANQLTVLPPEIGRLSRLEQLILTNNQLTALPPEIGQLKSLKSMYLKDNRLISLPTEMETLTALEFLDIAGNQVTALSINFERLINLNYLGLDGNPLAFPPLEIRQKGEVATAFYMVHYRSTALQQLIAPAAAGIGGIIALLLAFRWRQRRALAEKKKRV